MPLINPNIFDPRLPVLPQDHIPLFNLPPFNGQRSFTAAEIKDLFNILDGEYGQEASTWSAMPVPGPQASPIDDEILAQRETSLGPASTRPETEVDQPNPSAKAGPQRRRGVPKKTVLGQKIGKKSAVACERCRRRKEKCDGVGPHCGRCIKRGKRCIYKPGPRQVQRLRKAAARANGSPDAVERRRLIENDLMPRGRTEAAFGELAACSEDYPPSPFVFDLSTGGFDAEPSGVSQHAQGPTSTFGQLNIRPDEPLQYPSPLDRPTMRSMFYTRLRGRKS